MKESKFRGIWQQEKIMFYFNDVIALHLEYIWILNKSKYTHAITYRFTD